MAGVFAFQSYTPGYLDGMREHQLQDNGKDEQGDPKLLAEKIDLLMMQCVQLEEEAEEEKKNAFNFSISGDLKGEHNATS